MSLLLGNKSESLDVDWQEKAACKGTEGKENWFTRSPQVARKLREKYCSKCVVYDKCRAYAKETKVDYGVWGGDLAKQVKKED